MKRLITHLTNDLTDLYRRGTAKGKELITTDVIPANDKRGVRYIIEGKDNKEFFRKN